MTAEDDRLDAYLMDPDAPSAPEVHDLERRLAPLRFDVTRRPLEVPLPGLWPARRIVHTFALAAAAVAILALTVTAYWSWRWTWTAGAPWAAEIDRVSGAGAPLKTELAVDRPLQLSPSDFARIDIARIGTMRVTPGSAITLAETMSARHRVVLDRGTVSVRIWAPPGMFAFRTPSGSVRDLGCVFDLAVDADGTARVHVDTGWVQMDNDFGESLVPAGASGVMRRLLPPGVPVYDDSSEVFAASVRRAQDGGEAGERRELDTILRTARRRDVLTLLMLANASSGDLKRMVLARAAALSPPPPDVSVDAIAAGDRDQLWKWHDSLDLPPVKSWWRNWRDALPSRR